MHGAPTFPYLSTVPSVSLSLGGEALQAAGHPVTVDGYGLKRSSEPFRTARVPATLRMSTLSSLEPAALLPTASETHAHPLSSLSLARPYFPLLL